MIVFVDFGSQLAHLIVRRLKDIGVAAQLTAPEELMQTVSALQPKGIVLSGGPASVYQADAPMVDAAVFNLDVPVLGICYGWQLMAKLLGGKVESANKEYGIEELEVTTSSELTEGLPERLAVVMSHGDTVTELPPDFFTIGSTEAVEYAVVKHQRKNWYGVQFHPEAEHTEMGSTVLANFARVCLETLSKPTVSIDEMVDKVRTLVGAEKVICAVSGGVDSTVAAAVIAKAIGSRLTPVYVESGLMRANTKEKVEQIFTKIIPANLVVVEARDRFMTALEGITDPEAKRKTIGKLYVDIFNEVATRVSGVKLLAQGTIYSDVIESKGSRNAVVIKSHHNVGGLPKEMKLTLVEPLRQLYKDEVRAVGRKLGLPAEVIAAQPFPGPGYAIRIRGEVTEARLNQVKIADGIVMEEMRQAGLWQKVFQCFAVMTGAMSTAVKGDDRVFAEVVAIRAYESADVMTSQVAELPFSLMKRMAARIVNEVPGVSRVVYDLTGKPPATMEWE